MKNHIKKLFACLFWGVLAIYIVPLPFLFVIDKLCHLEFSSWIGIILGLWSILLSYGGRDIMFKFFNYKKFFPLKWIMKLSKEELDILSCYSGAHFKNNPIFYFIKVSDNSSGKMICDKLVYNKFLYKVDDFIKMSCKFDHGNFFNIPSQTLYVGGDKLSKYFFGKNIYNYKKSYIALY